MLTRNLFKWAAVIASGAMLLQAASCAETASVVTGIATTVTAGGVIYIITRIMD
jgi:hypothetical protein